MALVDRVVKKIKRGGDWISRRGSERVGCEEKEKGKKSPKIVILKDGGLCFMNTLDGYTPYKNEITTMMIIFCVISRAVLDRTSSKVL